jgi:hypothetical protein
MVAHLWANRSQEHARSNNGNLYFRDNTIYSYGDHFPIARWITNANGLSAVLFTTRRYATTTTQHTNRVRQAIASDVRVIDVNNPCNSFEENWRYALDELESLRGKADRARKYKYAYLSEIHQIMDDWNFLARFRDVPEPFDLTDINAELEDACEADRKRREVDYKKKEARDAEKKAKAEVILGRWIAGENVRVSNLSSYSGYVRIRAVGDTLQTSEGAECPLHDAINIFRIAQKCRAEERQFVPTFGRPVIVGSFELRWIDEQGTIVVGCHTIQWHEAERLARELEILS